MYQPKTDLSGKEKMVKPISSELVLRFNSALILAAISLTATYAGPQTFGLFILCASVLMSWEWCRVVRGRNFDAIFLLQIAAVISAGIPHAPWLAGHCHRRDRRRGLGILLGAGSAGA